MKTELAKQLDALLGNDRKLSGILEELAEVVMARADSANDKAMVTKLRRAAHQIDQLAGRFHAQSL